MKNLLKRFSCLVLAGVIAGSAAVMTVSANSGAKECHTLETAIEYFEGVYGEEVETTRYYFYMPDEWRNEYNDYYDGSDLSSCVPGVYWYGSLLCLPEEYPAHENGWPGYAVTKRETDNIFVAEVPSDVHTIVFNNLVDGGMDRNSDVYDAAYQIVDTPTCYDGADDYGFYPNGLESTADMIYVIDPDSWWSYWCSMGKGPNVGAWFYYYGNGEYGITPEKGTEVYKDGQFPGRCNHNYMTIGAREATYFASGYTGVEICELCNEIFSWGYDIKQKTLDQPVVEITGGKKNITVKYTKVEDATGFEVKYKRGNKSFIKTYKTKKDAVKTIKKLAKDIYKVRVRAYIKKGNIIAYSSWSTPVKVKVK